ncbi:MAG: type I restriction enzyme S subunit [Nitrospirae bacterium]|nr:MAG: type I restriction enzyme S subunit [Nitrospirota bacterium]
MSELPLKWECVDISTFLYPVTTGVKPFIGKRKYYSTGSINGKAYLNEGEYTFQERPARANRMAEEGDVLQARMQGTDKVLLIDKSLSGQLFSTGFLQFRIIEKTYVSKLLLFFMKSGYFLKQRDEFATGSTQIALTDRGLSNIKLLVPPFNEQLRIVAKLEKLLHKIDACKERLDKIPLILKRFRQSVLSAACSGRLTEDWRKEHNEPEWKDAKIGDYCLDSFYGPRFGREEYVPEGIPTIRTTDFTDNGKIILSRPPCVLIPNEKKGKFLLRKNDLLITRTGSIGKMAIFRENYEAIPSAYLIRFRFKPEVSVDYLFLWLMSPEGQNLLGLGATAVTQPNVNAETIKGMPIPLPSLPEQQEIVRRVEALFKKADAIETRYKKAKAFVDKLTQSILAKAFRGELVAQDPNDEPASVLLERIRAEKQKSQKKVVSIKDRVEKYKPFIPSDLPMAAEEKAPYGNKRKKKRER